MQASKDFGIPDAEELGYEKVVYPFFLLMCGLIVAAVLLIIEVVKSLCGNPAEKNKYALEV
jgi:hypothetical protein